MRKMILAAILLLSMSPAMASDYEYPTLQKILLIPYALAEFYRTTCEAGGGVYVNDDPSFVQGWSCRGWTRPQ